MRSQAACALKKKRPLYITVPFYLVDKCFLDLNSRWKKKLAFFLTCTMKFQPRHELNFRSINFRTNRRMWEIWALDMVYSVINIPKTFFFSGRVTWKMNDSNKQGNSSLWINVTTFQLKRDALSLSLSLWCERLHWRTRCDCIRCCECHWYRKSTCFWWRSRRCSILFSWYHHYSRSICYWWSTQCESINPLWNRQFQKLVKKQWGPFLVRNTTW